MSGTQDQQNLYLLKRWIPAVCCCFVPFLCFVGVLEVFGAGELSLSGQYRGAGKTFINLFSDEGTVQALSLLKLDARLVHYSGLLLVHGLISVVLLVYFLISYRSASAWFEGGRGVRRGFLLIFIVAVFAVVSCLVLTQNSFSRLTLQVPGELLQLTGMEARLLPVLGEVKVLLRGALLVPVLFAVPAVVMASATFHLRVLRPAVLKREQLESIRGSLHSLKRGLMLLSLMLVSAVITAGNFFELVPASLAVEKNEFIQVYLELAGSLTFSSGMLFTTILAATFLPGCGLLYLQINALKRSSQPSAAIEEKLKEVGFSMNMVDLLKVLLALMAPAITGPVLEVTKALA